MTRVSYSTSNRAIIDGAECFTEDLLSLSQGIPRVFDLVEQYPEDFIPNLLVAIVNLYGQTDATAKLVKEHLDQAQKSVKHINQREVLLLAGINYQLQRDYQRAIDVYFSLNQLNPRDLLATKLAEFCYYCLGQAYEAKQFLNHTQFIYQENQQDPLFLSMHSFAHELNGHYGEAKTYAEEAVNLRSSNAWAHHTLLHLYINQKQLTEGIAALHPFIESWKQENDVMIFSHNLWHVALLYLEQLDFTTIKGNYSPCASLIFPANAI